MRLRLTLTGLVCLLLASCGPGTRTEPGTFSVAYTVRDRADYPFPLYEQMGYLYLAGGEGKEITWNYPVNPDDMVYLFDFSPGGDFAVLFTSTVAQGAGLYITDLRSSSPSLLYKVAQTFLPTGGSYLEPIRFTPDGRWIVYIACPETSNWDHLYAVNVEGGIPGIPYDLLPALPHGRDVFDFSVGADGSIIFSSDILSDVGGPIRSDLFYVDLSGDVPSVPEQITPDQGFIGGFTPNGKIFLYTTLTHGMILRTVGETGLSDPVFVSVRDTTEDFIFSPDSTRAAFLDSYHKDLYLIDLNGGTAPVARIVGSNDSEIWSWSFSLDGTHLFYGSADAIWAVDLRGSEASKPVKISRDADGEITRSYASSPNGEFVAYYMYEGGDTYDLFVSRSDGQSDPVRIEDLLSDPEEVDDVPNFIISSDSSRIIFSVARGDFVSIYQLKAGDGQPGSLEKVINGPKTAYPVMVMEGNSPLIYQSELDETTPIELFSQLRVADLSTRFPAESSPLFPGPDDYPYNPVWLSEVVPQYTPSIWADRY